MTFAPGLYSLDKLSSNLSVDSFIYTKEEIDGDLDLMRKKGVYPCDYMDSFIRFDETSLPKRYFYSQLYDEDIRAWTNDKCLPTKHHQTLFGDQTFYRLDTLFGAV